MPLLFTVAASVGCGHWPSGAVQAKGDLILIQCRGAEPADADEAAYRVTGKHLRSEGERRKMRLRVHRLGNGSPPPKLFYAG